MKIIDGLIQFEFETETNKFHYYLYGNYSSYAIKWRENCSAKNDIFIGNGWGSICSWKPLGFERSIVYG